MRSIFLCGVAVAMIQSGSAHAEALSDTAKKGEAAGDAQEIIVTGNQYSGTKTETPLIETPQPITVVPAEQYLEQGAISVSDTVKYTAGVLTNAYGRDTRVDSFTVRGINALQFRDGMRDIFSSYASITADPYNFERVEVVRGPASVLFGQGSIGGLVNLVSKTPTFTTGGEMRAVYGSYDRKEVMGDVNVALSNSLAVRLVGRARNADTYIAHVPDDRYFIAPSLRWQPTPDTDLVLTGLYQDDKTGSTSQFLPIVGTLRPNGDNPRLDPFLSLAKPGFDRYDGTSKQGMGSVTHRFGDLVKLSLKARYIRADVDYFSRYPNSYSNPANPYLDPARRRIGVISSGSIASTDVFSTDNNLLFSFNTGGAIEHRLLVGLDYSWNKVTKRQGRGSDIVDIYDIDYDSLSEPVVSATPTVDSQKQLGIYVQDQIRFFDRISVVLGGRRDRVTSNTGRVDKATTFRAGIIGEIGAGISPFFSYTESFLPVAGSDQNGRAYIPQTGRQFEAGVKWQADPDTLVTVTAFHIKERNRLIYGPGGTTFQSGELTTKGVELEARRILPENFELLVNYGYNDLSLGDTPNLTVLPRHVASVWATKTFGAPNEQQLKLGVGGVYTGKRLSIGNIDDPATNITTPDYFTVDALAEVTWNQWRLAVNATNLLDHRYFASCLARGDCFVGAPRNVMATLGYRF
ncbi:TonB-dependent siderophore receptor [Stakelama pacifica]|uniref:Iron complex outermembrane receptor protein n=1 Tax=Stakelama pacifica TaxID=517720 RepID=A0A4R6FMU0_9SPHN|nr:TonB-dependent siderophore receptor [Stakelama pacifica]TDN82843.1 iron complex outermembrane receptor protein [Stakelama pacifica]